MWWVIGAVASFIMLFCYCACVLAGRADDKKNQWMSREEEGTAKSVPSEMDFQYSPRSGVCPPPEPSTLLLFDSSFVGFRKKI
jgi:hypothetical protein